MTKPLHKFPYNYHVYYRKLRERNVGRAYSHAKHNFHRENDERAKFKISREGTRGTR